MINYKEDFKKCNKVFVYGTLKQGYGNHYILENSKLISSNVITLEKFNLYDVGFPYAVENGNYFIKGELYKIDSMETFERLDWLEGYPSHYNRKIIPVLEYNNTGIVRLHYAWIYYIESIDEDLTPCNNIKELELNFIINEWRR